jgi:hypothetical protein
MGMDMGMDMGIGTPASRRLMLRPGWRVFRRDDQHVQVGIDEPRLVLRDSPGVRRLLAHLESGTALGSLTPEAGLALVRLSEQGLVVDRADLARARTAGSLAIRQRVVTDVFAAHGPDAPTRLASRATCRVAVDATEPWQSRLADWLTDAGLVMAEPQIDAGTVTLLLSIGEPRRSTVDELVRADQPHLLVTLLPDRVRVGPFVMPGVTACHRCVDAHLGEKDPRRALVLEQLEDSSPTRGPYDQLLAHAGVAIAVRDVASYADGERPTTWSATLTLSAELMLPRETWSRHPHCGCSWA